jgi:hypothetical protein
MGLEEVRQRGMERIALAQERDRWRAVVNAEMNLRISINWDFFHLRTCLFLKKDRVPWS